jgi:peptidoglycan hydrolase CwlO-like protein
MAMNSSNKINTTVLENHVKDVLSAAKTKLSDLNKDIDKISKENDDLQRSVESASQFK